MRPPVEAQSIRELARGLSRIAREPVRIYLTGGATRSPFVFHEGNVAVHYFDLYSQALSKIERGFTHDLEDLKAMIEHGFVEPSTLRGLFDAIEPELYRYPAIDPTAFRAKIERALR